jgi:adenylate cyclase class IV
VRATFDPFRLLLISIAGWLGQQQRDVIDYLQEENRALRQQLGNKRLRLNDDQRRRLAAKAKKLGRRIPREVATIVTVVPANSNLIDKLRVVLSSSILASPRILSVPRVPFEVVPEPRRTPA